MWSKPKAVGSAGQCDALAAVIDGSGRDHLAAACDGRIRYSVQSRADWDTAEFAVPAQRIERDPQLAFERDLLYLAYTRIAVQEGGCGDPGLRDVGVYVRTRSLPAGSWSEPTKIGETDDHLQALRIVGGTIHATVQNGGVDGPIYYETVNSSTYHRYPIPQATGKVALRIGDDGKARVVYEADGGLRYGVFSGSTLTAAEIAGSQRGYSPVLVLGAGDQPYLLWRRGYHGRGCAEPDPEPDDGTYYGTKVDGAWTSERLTADQGVASLTVDVDADRVHALVSGHDGLTYLARTGSGSWSTKTLDDQSPGDAVIRLDPQTEALLVAYLRYDEQASSVYVITYR